MAQRELELDRGDRGERLLGPAQHFQIMPLRVDGQEDALADQHEL
jgi:hypothetical protein